MSAAQASSVGGEVAVLRAGSTRTIMESVRAVLAASALLAFAVTATNMALNFGVEARRLPLVVGVPLTVMAVMNLVLVIRTQRAALARSSEPVSVGTAATADEPMTVGGADQNAEQSAVKEPEAALRAALASEGGLEDATEEGLSFPAAMLSVATVTGLFFLLGLVPAAIIYTVGFMKGVGKESWTKSIIVPTLLVFMFWLFRNYLNVRFYRGWLVTEGFIPYVLPF